LSLTLLQFFQLALLPFVFVFLDLERVQVSHIDVDVVVVVAAAAEVVVMIGRDDAEGRNSPNCYENLSKDTNKLMLFCGFLNLNQKSKIKLYFNSNPNTQRQKVGNSKAEMSRYRVVMR
jgi:hypothetical protein